MEIWSSVLILNFGQLFVAEEGSTMSGFAEDKNIPLSKGSTYYELIKAEKVSKTKQIIVLQNGKLETSSSVARKLANIPAYDQFNR